jgi:hypothetical protein
MKSSIAIIHIGNIKSINGSHASINFYYSFSIIAKGNFGKKFLSQSYFIKSHDYII